MNFSLDLFEFINSTKPVSPDGGGTDDRANGQPTIPNGDTTDNTMTYIIVGIGIIVAVAILVFGALACEKVFLIRLRLHRWGRRPAPASIPSDTISSCSTSSEEPDLNNVGGRTSVIPAYYYLASAPYRLNQQQTMNVAGDVAQNQKKF